MIPSAQRDGKLIGFMKGFKLQDQNWLSDFQKSVWNGSGNEGDLNKKRFQIAYLEEYRKGKIQRQNIQNEIKNKLGEITSQDQIIQDEFLDQIFDSFYGVSCLFETWEERIEKEIFPKNEKVNSIEALKTKTISLLEAKSYQKSLQCLKEIFIKKGDSKLFHKSLKADSELRNIRFKSKQKK